MANPELNGLASILASTGAFHSTALPPVPLDYETTEEYREAYEAWWVNTHMWRASKT